MFAGETEDDDLLQHKYILSDRRTNMSTGTLE